MKTVFSLMLLASLNACATTAEPPVVNSNKPVPVEIFTGGDDGFTVRLADAVRSEFEKSPLFTLATDPANHALIVKIPTHVEWHDVGTKTRISYKLRLERAGQVLMESGGTCWETEMQVCAESILDSADRATRL